MAPGSSRLVGTVEALLRGSALVDRAAANAAGAGTVLAAVDRASGASLVPVPFDPTLLAAERFVWTGEDWIAVKRELDEPPITLVAAAPIAPFIAPFQQAARAGSLTLTAVTITAFLLTLFLTGRLTQSLERLAAAADAVSRGDLDRRVDASEGDEVGRVAHAFNTMTESLRQTLLRLSQREAVAAVGELASTLAHEVRNPLSAIRLHLQHAEEQLGDRNPVAQSVSRALHDVGRLERTVAGTLRIAQSGRMELAPVDLQPAIEAARRTAASEFIARGAVLEPLREPLGPMRLRGNAAGLEQAFTNLLVNAAQAVEPGGHVGLEIATSSTGYTVTVWDTGRGLEPAELERAFEPFYSTKPEGTGLGLSIVRRIVNAHGGHVAIESARGIGTRVCVTLSALNE
jgi:signal transduction histidine kinase